MANDFPALDTQTQVLTDLISRGRPAGDKTTQVLLTVKQVAWLTRWTRNEIVEPKRENGFRKNVAVPSFRGPENFTWQLVDTFEFGEDRGWITLHRFPNHAGVLTYTRYTRQSELDAQKQARLDELDRACNTYYRALREHASELDETFKADLLAEVTKLEDEAEALRKS